MRKLGFAPYGDKAWTTIDNASYLDVTYYKDMFYAINDFYYIMACDVRGDNPTIAQQLTQMPSHIQKFGRGWKLYILESAGALLVVERKLILGFRCQREHYQMDRGQTLGQ
ncbi:hypothetical protein Dsin_020721 [Dipteronia sinensis]|uniref:KIB1-4 beta-propeller domain-containing protein n=1 Tax=Dipteronia sinensis TaxID=43782 RepID=A0AAE0AA12_9ROSI|nr:hypothetical protein Dsin_020721 [Dipteronia sinensis]